MIFGSTPLADADGAVLAHSVTANGVRMKKGRRLSKDDLDVLAKAGIVEVIAARLEAGGNLDKQLLLAGGSCD